MENKGDTEQHESLEQTETVVESGNSPAAQNSAGQPAAASAIDPKSAPGSQNQSAAPPKKQKGIKSLFLNINIYLLGIIFVIVIAVIVVVIAFTQSKVSTKNNSINSQNLTQAQLNELQGTNPIIGTSNQDLTIQSNTTFNGSVLVRSNLNIAGTIVVGGNISLPGITVSGSSNFGTVQANQLNVAGNINANGNVVIQKNLTVNGVATFGGEVSVEQLTVSSLVLSGDLQVTHHIVTSGSSPSRIDGPALGVGGTSSLSGTDTAGIITLNTGSGTSADSCFITVTFAQQFSSTPSVVVSPVGENSAGIDYYLTVSNSQFSLCTATKAASGVTFSFDYITVE
jgi:cytoskeletal protein CcmA (bactofilin family)